MTSWSQFYLNSNVMRLFLLALICTLVRLEAQQAPPVPAPLGPPLPPALPPLPPVPLDFRQLLSMPASEREKALAGRSPADRQIIEAKLKEYDALSPEEREMRLRAVQLRLYLRPLMQVAPSNRAERIAAIPEPDRDLINRRLANWDRLPGELQRELLENESALSALVHPDIALPRGSTGAPGLPPQQRPILEGAIERWNALPEEKRRQINEHFQSIFQLDDREKARFLEPLSEPERRQMLYTLRTFRGLTPAQREACLAGVHKFTELSAEERQTFLRNAELWQEMPPRDRQLWREIVARFRIQRAPLPPMPPPPLPRVPRPPESTLVATNN